MESLSVHIVPITDSCQFDYNDECTMRVTVCAKVSPSARPADNHILQHLT